MVRKYASVIVCLFLFANPLVAQKTSHYATVGVAAGASGYQVNIGPEAGLSVGYALQNRHFLFHTGLEAVYAYRMGSPVDYTDSIPSIDTQQDPYLLRLAYHDIHTSMRSFRLAIPLRFGGQWNAFYFTAGPSFSIHIAHSKQTAELTSTAEYDFLMDPFVNMPNHGLTTTLIDEPWTSMPVSAGMDASAEIGWIISSDAPTLHQPHVVPHDWRLALYTDIGLWRSNASFQPADTWSAGIRLSVWFGFPHHYPCRCLF